MKNIVRFRGEQIAYLIFSRNENLTIIENEDKDNSIYDFLVDIKDGGKNLGWFFGVELKAIEGNDYSTILNKFNLSKYKNVKIPLILAVVDVIKSNGHYLWIKKPDLTGSLISIDIKNTLLIEMTNSNLNELINEIKVWYDKK